MLLGTKSLILLGEYLRLMLILLYVLCMSRHTTAQQIWFAPPDDLPRGGGRVYAPDFMELVEPGFEASHAMSKIQVFEMTPRFPIAASDAELTQVLNYLRAQKIALTVAMGIVPKGQNCGYNVEGMTLPNGPAAIAERIKRLGGDLQYINMDEPLMFGHEYVGRNACRFSIAEVAAGVAEMIRTVRVFFPDVQIGDAEPTDNFRGPGWLTRIETWLDAYQKATGKPLVFLQQDTWWDGPWRQRTPQLVAALHRRGIKYGMMFNAGGDPPDAVWIAKAQQNVRDFEAVMKSPPDQAIFTSWTTHPLHVLPETTPTTLTYLIDWYVDRRH